MDARSNVEMVGRACEEWWWCLSKGDSEHESLVSIYHREVSENLSRPQVPSWVSVKEGCTRKAGSSRAWGCLSPFPVSPHKPNK